MNDQPVIAELPLTLIAGLPAYSFLPLPLILLANERRKPPQVVPASTGSGYAIAGGP